MRLLPLGGLGEIGKNMTVVEHDGRIVVVDAGLMFPTAEMLGIDLVLPDFTYLRERAGEIEAIVLTHGHEDHVGALPYVLREIGLPPAIYGGPLTIGLVRSKLEEHKIRDAPLQVLDPGTVVEAGPFGIELIHMSHSIPDACAVAVTTSLGTVLATGDYKFDQTPVDGVAADTTRLAELGREGLLCLFGDSTNADRPRGRAVGVGGRAGAAGGRSRAARAGSSSPASPPTCTACSRSSTRPSELDRRVALVGRSMRKNFNIASNLGIASAPSGLLISPKEIEDFPDHKVIAISTGSQGEPLSALRRMAFNDHRDVELHSGDTVVFSATPDPRQRALGERDDRPDLRDRRRGGDRGRRADPRFGARLAGGAEADAQPDQAALRAAGARRPPPAAPARGPRRGGRDRSGADLPGPQRGRARDRR